MLLLELCGRHCAGAVGGRGVGNIFSLGRRWHGRWKGVHLWPFEGVEGGPRWVSTRAHPHLMRGSSFPDPLPCCDAEHLVKPPQHAAVVYQLSRSTGGGRCFDAGGART